VAAREGGVSIWCEEREKMRPVSIHAVPVAFPSSDVTDRLEVDRRWIEDVQDPE
jgi:hypothetical protein